MNSKSFKLYIDELRKVNDVAVGEDLFEKDYILSSFLSNWSKISTPNLDRLVFKGGTLLTKNYLNYHRISEDLDFVHEDSNELRLISTVGRQETQIKQRVIPIIDELKELADLSNLEFETDRSNSRFIIQRNSRHLYVFNFYYSSLITKREDKIKLEISFVEDLINDPVSAEIKTIVDFKISDVVLLKQLTNYNLEKPILKIYLIEEVILEKIRALITREQFKPRDVFDLYLINKLTNIFNQSKDDLFRKLRASPFNKEDIRKNIKNFLSEKIVVDLDDILNLSLINFNELEFIEFSKKLILYSKELSKEFLELND